MSKKELTKEDISKIKKINLLRLSNDWYSVLYRSTVLIYVYSFFFPYYGWRRKPTHIPENTEEYINAVIDLHLFFLPLVILSIANILVKKIEVLKNYKTEKKAKVVLKFKIFKRVRIIIFNSYHLLFFSNTFKYNDVERNDNIIIETTSFRRLLNYKKEA
jgi:membrane-associated HD superfamily phosphohydrolase